MRGYETALSEWMKDHGLGLLAFSVKERYYQRFKSNEMHKFGKLKSRSMSLSEPLNPSEWRSKSLHNLSKGLVDIGYGLQTLETLKGMFFISVFILEFDFNFVFISAEYRNFGVYVGVYWLNFVTAIGMKIMVLVVSLAWLGVAFYGMTTIKPIEENENFAGDSTFLMQSLYKVNEYTSSSAMRNDFSVMWGTSGLKKNSRKGTYLFLVVN